MNLFFIKNFSIYFAFNCVVSILPIALMPILTKYMTPEDYGLYSVYSLLVMFFGILTRFELNASLKREFVSGKDDFGEYVGSAFVFSLIMLFPFLLVLYSISIFVDSFFGIGFFWIFFLFPLVFFRGQVMNLHHLWQINNNSFLYGFWALSSSIFMYLLSIFILIKFDSGWKARVVAEWIIGFFSFFIGIYFLRKNFNAVFVFKYSLLKKMLKYSFPLIPGALISYCIIASDRYFLAEFSTAHELGLYSIALQLSFSLSLFFSAVHPVWESYIFNKIGSVDCIVFKKLSVVLVLFVFFGVLVVLCLAYVLYFIIPYLVSSEFFDADEYVVPCLLIALAGGIYRLSNAVLVYMRQTKKVLLVSFLMLIIDLGLMFIFVEDYGAKGIGYALALTFFCGVFLNMNYVYRHRVLSKG